MREKQPRLLVIWGKYDLSFDPIEPERYGAMSQRPKSTFSMPAISRSIPQPTRLPQLVRALYEDGEVATQGESKTPAR